MQTGELEIGFKLMHLSTTLGPEKYSFNFNLAGFLYRHSRIKNAQKAAFKAVKIRTKSDEAWRLIESIICKANTDIDAKEVSLNVCLFLKESPERIESYAIYLYNEKRYKCSINTFK